MDWAKGNKMERGVWPKFAWIISVWTNRPDFGMPMTQVSNVFNHGLVATTDLKRSRDDGKIQGNKTSGNEAQNEPISASNNSSLIVQIEAKWSLNPRLRNDEFRRKRKQKRRPSR